MTIYVTPFDACRPIMHTPPRVVWNVIARYDQEPFVNSFDTKADAIRYIAYDLREQVDPDVTEPIGPDGDDINDILKKILTGYWTDEKLGEVWDSWLDQELGSYFQGEPAYWIWDSQISIVPVLKTYD